MVRISGESRNCIILIVLLSLLGVRLAQSAITARNFHSKLSKMVDEHASGFAFGATSGVDTKGNVSLDESGARKSAVVIFMLRSRTFEQDTQYWNAVATSNNESPVHLLAYCDGQECSRRSRQSEVTLHFPVMAFGEVVSVEALIDADSKGNAFLRSPGRAGTTALRWRESGKTPSQLALEIANDIQ